MNSGKLRCEARALFRGTEEQSRANRAGLLACRHLESHNEVGEMELSFQVQLDGDHWNTCSRNGGVKVLRSLVTSPNHSNDLLRGSPFSDCHQAVRRCGAKLVTTFWIRWLFGLSRAEKGRRESHRKHFFSSWIGWHLG